MNENNFISVWLWAGLVCVQDAEYVIIVNLKFDIFDVPFTSVSILCTRSMIKPCPNNAMPFWHDWKNKRFTVIENCGQACAEMILALKPTVTLDSHVDRWAYRVYQPIIESKQQLAQKMWRHGSCAALLMFVMTCCEGGLGTWCGN